ncbi:MAG: hypothetical protein Q9220_007393 [cf. Caloplaca sp. 1 TL-2023]
MSSPSRLPPDNGDNSFFERPRDLNFDETILEYSLKASKKRLKLHTSFDIIYWTNFERLAERGLELNAVKRQILLNLVPKDGAFDKYERGVADEKLLMQQKSILVDLRIAQEQQLDRSQGHLFPWKAGPEAMIAIFGEEAPPESELFQAQNGILWCREAADRFSLGHFCIVPDIPDDNPTAEQCQTWQDAEVKEYKIRVLNPTDPMMGKVVAYSEKRWCDLDHKRLKFRNSFRPRDRYLYFAYFRGYAEEGVCGKIRGRWSNDRSVTRKVLRGFVHVMGCEHFEHVLEGSVEEEEEEDGGEVDVRGVMVANEHIQDCLDDGDEEESSDDDDENDEEDSGDEEDGYKIDDGRDGRKEMTD